MEGKHVQNLLRMRCNVLFADLGGLQDGLPRIGQPLRGKDAALVSWVTSRSRPRLPDAP